jgi:hypothetical protein
MSRKLCVAILLSATYGNTNDCGVISSLEFPLELQEVYELARLRFPEYLWKIEKNDEGEWLFYNKAILPEDQE